MNKSLFLFLLPFLFSCGDSDLKGGGILPSPERPQAPTLPPSLPNPIQPIDPRPPTTSDPTLMMPWRNIKVIKKPDDLREPNRSIVRTVTETFKREEVEKKADILWVIDNSCSMEEERNNVARNLDAFISNFNVNDLDYQMAVISTHTNNALFYGNPPILKHDDPQLKERFSERIRMEEVCTGNAAGLYAAHLALSEPRRSGKNRGFLRDEAFLFMIIISDADEDYEMTSPAYYAFFTSLKPAKPYKINISSIVGDRPDGCFSQNGNAQPGLQYIELSEMTRGFFESICNIDFSETLNRIGKNLNEYVNAYHLKSIPNENFPIIVKVNGRVIERHPTRGWIYNQAINAIQFNGTYQPQVGDQIEVIYRTDA